MAVREDVLKMKAAAPYLASTTREQRDAALEAVACALEANADAVFEANARDLAAAEESGVAQSIVQRLRFDGHKLEDVLAGIRQLAGLADPTGQTTLLRELDEGLVLRRVTCPIGVIGVIFEARPDALVQISTLCLKSGNCAVLKGGSETAETNRVLFNIIHDAAAQAGLPQACLLQVEAHAEIDELLACDDCVDLLIPRGSNAFVRYIMDHTKIPVMGHADGMCHIYVDAAADFDLACRVIVDAKTQYPAACNAVETILVARAAAPAFLPKLGEALAQAGVGIRATEEAGELLGADCGWEAVEVGDFREYLECTLSIALVDSVGQACDFVNEHGSHHTDCIITEDDEAADTFMRLVDSAGVYRNCSTRFADGFRYGFGAEVGISTAKVHARGPVGLEGLVTYKYLLEGQGHIVGDYATGKRAFTHRDL